MSFRTILAVYSGVADGHASLGMALAMQRHWSLHVTGLAWHGIHSLQRDAPLALPRDILNILAERDAETVAEIRSGFQAVVSERGDAARAEFLEISSNGNLTLAETARGFDLVVMGRHSSDSERSHFSGRPDVVALRSGRPVIVTPPHHVADGVPQKVVVGWDGKRNSARAILDAMPFLTAADEVMVLSIGKAPYEHPGASIADLLRRHEVNARFETRPAERGGPGHGLVDAATELGAGLLVVGAYEHSKFQEDLLGGVTNLLLEEAPLPVFMSH